jgi:uncharacterized protein (DUF697 family)
LATNLLQKYTLVAFLVNLLYGISYYLIFHASSIFLICTISAFIALSSLPFANTKISPWVLMVTAMVTIYGSSVFMGWLKSPVLFWLGVLPHIGRWMGIPVRQSVLTAAISYSLFLSLAYFYNQSISPELTDGEMLLAGCFALVGITAVNLLFNILYEAALAEKQREIFARYDHIWCRLG